MSEARDQILGRLCQRLPRGPAESAALEARLARPARNVMPARAQLGQAERIELFVKMAEEAAASVQRTATLNDAPAAIAEFLLRENLPNAIVLAPDPVLAALPWDQQPRLRIERRRAHNGDIVAVSPAFAGIAETGTLMLLSGPESPTTLNFLPDVHIVILSAARIVGPYEDAWDWLRGRGVLPRTVNWITGPSRSADIEQTLQLGAHGPLRLHIVLAER